MDGWVPSQLLFGVDNNPWSHTICFYAYFYYITFTSRDNQVKPPSYEMPPNEKAKHSVWQYQS